MSFDLARHTDRDILACPRRSKRNYSGLLNLSSNELNHSGVRLLYEDFVEGFSSDDVTRYPYIHEAEHSIAAFSKIDPQNVVVSPGSDEAIKMLMFTLGRNSKSLIVQSPNYRSYFQYAAACGMNTTKVRFLGLPGDEFTSTLEATLMTKEPSLVTITNPNGYDGGVIRQDDITRITESCRINGHVLVIDEAYAAFSGVNHTDLAIDSENVIILRSFSKTLGIAGLRLAAVVTNPELADYLSRWNSVSTVSVHSIRFMNFCFAHYSTISQFHVDIAEAKQWMFWQLRERFPRWRIYESSANFILVDTGSAGTAVAVAQHLLQKNIVVRSFAEDIDLVNCIRITVGDRQCMGLLMRALEEFGAPGVTH